MAAVHCTLGLAIFVLPFLGKLKLNDILFVQISANTASAATQQAS
jgi:hypothetical protein